MKAARLRQAVATLVTPLVFLQASSVWAVPVYDLITQIPGSGGAWDYAAIDDASEHLYLAQRGVTVLDLKTNQLTTDLVTSGVTHGVLPLHDGKVAVADGTNREVKLFEGISGKIVGKISTANFGSASGMHALDALVWEPKSALIAAVDGESGTLLLIDRNRLAVTGTIPLGGKPEFAVADGRGYVYINVVKNGVAMIAVADVASKRIKRYFPMRGCNDPTGLAYDRADRLLISVCGNGVAEFIRENGSTAAHLRVGKGADAVMFDSQRKMVLVPGGSDGVLSIISVRSVSSIRVIQTLNTKKGARLGAVDNKTGQVYLPVADLGAPVPPSPYPSVIAGTFRILVVAPRHAK
ncbi:YncE family protein [Paraburkholderia megapolitana]|uniref:YncE family protein n=1 Tax=Paraburkholderia megapolitana TaxID=420953 RepID=UPI0038B75DC9